MHEALIKIANNPQALSSSEVLQLLNSKAITKDDLACVVGKEIVDELINHKNQREKNSNTRDKSAADSHSPIASDYTQVFFWGKQGCGKSTAITAVIEACKELGTKSINGNYVEVEVKRTLGKEVYPLFFVEVDMDASDYYEVAKEYINEPNQKVHIFCMDGSLPKEKRAIQDAQANAFEKLLGRLESDGILGRSNGIYILVTKTDAILRVPKAYREGAAQTKITADHSRLWRKVLNVDYDQNIYDSTPIAFSVGEVMFQDIIKPDLTDARKFLRKPLLEKCDSRRNWLGRLLNRGNGFISVLLLTLVVGLLGAMGYLFFDMLPSAPSSEVPSFDYKSYFKKEEAMVQTGYYNDAVSLYDKLRTDLNVEHKIQCVKDTASEEMSLLANEDFEELDKLLTNDYAKRLMDQYNELLNGNWAMGVNRSQINGIWHRSQTLRTAYSAHLKGAYATKLQQYDGYVSTYDKDIAPLIRLSRNCSTLSDVHKVKNGIGNYDEWPYTSDRELASSIRNATSNAYKSYAENLRVRAQGWRNSYEKARPRDAWGNIVGTFKSLMGNSLEDRYRQYTQSLREEINEALSDINSFDQPEAYSILENARQLISF